MPKKGKTCQSQRKWLVELTWNKTLKNGPLCAVPGNLRRVLSGYWGSASGCRGTLHNLFLGSPAFESADGAALRPVGGPGLSPTFPAQALICVTFHPCKFFLLPTASPPSMEFFLMLPPPPFSDFSQTLQPSFFHSLTFNLKYNCIASSYICRVNFDSSKRL